LSKLGIENIPTISMQRFDPRAVVVPAVDTGVHRRSYVHRQDAWQHFDGAADANEMRDILVETF
jgi:hypothetical protein